MADITRTAIAVGDWSGIGIVPSKELAEALQAYELVRFTEVGHRPIFNIEGMSAKNAEARIMQLAQELSVKATPAGGGWSPIEQAKRQALDVAARRVAALARDFVPEAVAQLEPEFTKAAEAYVAAVEALPEDVTSEALIYGGAEIVTAYNAARDHVGHLVKVSGWVTSLHDLTGRTGAVERVIKIVRPTTPDQLRALDVAVREQAVNPALSAIDPVLLTAVREGISFEIVTPAEAAQIRADLTLVGMGGVA